jgi:ribulose-phosphate 3-epimerase
MYEIIPGILEKEWAEIERKINLVKSFAKVIHIDIIDGKFAPNTTFLDPTPFAKYSKDLLLEVHLMVDEPINYLKPFAAAGFKRFLGHIEKMSDQVEFVAQGELLGEVGLAIDGPTDLSAVKIPYEDLDSILVMSIKAGQSGQAFVPEYLKKARTLRQAQGQFLSIEIDGGINDKTIVEARNAGATSFVTNSFLFKTNDVYNNYKTIINKLKT